VTAPALTWTKGASCTIAVVGDSLSDPKSNGGGYLRELQKHCNCSVAQFSRGGFMVNQMRRRFEAEAPTSGTPYSHVVVFGGVNDLYSDETAGRTPEKVERDLLAIYGLGHRLGAKVVAITVSPWGGFTRWYSPKRAADMRRLNDWIRQQVAVGVIEAVIDSEALLSCGQPELLCPELASPYKDGLHFGPAGHRRLGEALWHQAFEGCPAPQAILEPAP
jgi:lysophospholipase L1-like esterase